MEMCVCQMKTMEKDCVSEEYDGNWCVSTNIETDHATENNDNGLYLQLKIE